jgi:hypothetical protein
MSSDKFNLYQYKTDSPSEATHLMFGKRSGKFIIPLNEKINLYKFVEKNPTYCVTEKPGNIFPLFFDIDNLNDDIDIKEFKNTVIKPNIFKRVDEDSISRKHKIGYILRNQKKTRNFHIHFPFIFVKKSTAISIANLINEKYPKSIDTTVYNNGLRLFNTKKINKQNEIEMETNYEFINEKYQEKKLENKIKLVSIIPENKSISESRLRQDYDEEEEEKEKEENKKSNSKFDINLSKLCNAITGFKDEIWESKLKPGSDDIYILSMTSSKICLSEFLKNGNRHIHSNNNHSCIYVNKSSATASCLNHSEHGTHKLTYKEFPKLKDIKKLLGLIKNEDDKNDFQLLTEIIVTDAKKHNYKRNNSWVMKPNKDIPIVYEKYMEYSEYVNEIFMQIESEEDKKNYNLFRKNHTNMKKLLTYLTDYNDIDFPKMIADKHIFAFKNGYLDISDLYKLKFIKYEDMDKRKLPSTSIYYEYDFQDEWFKLENMKTPKFDGLCQYHLQDDEIYHIFLGLIGRLHYPIQKYDRFNCVPYIRGGTNTGKSTTGNIIMSNHQNIGTISGKMEDTFGLQTLYQKNIIYVQECPKNIHKKLDKTDFQRMIEGSQMDIPRKGLPSINDFHWDIPMLWLGNFFPEYTDSSGAIPRRLCIFFMERYVDASKKNTNLEKECIEEEGHFILLKSLYYYKELIEKRGNKTCEDWGIEYFKKGYEGIMSTCNYLHNFLNLAAEEYDCWPIYEEGAEIPVKGKYRKNGKELDGFAKTLERYLYFEKSPTKKWNRDQTTLERNGYKLISKKVCSRCTKVIEEDKICCKKYHERNVRTKDYIQNMVIQYKRTRLDIEVSDDEEDE